MYEYKGAIHLHSNYSHDATATVDEIMQAAIDARLDFVIITDHNTIGAKIDKKEGWYKNTLLIVGEEISPPFNHYIIIGDKPFENMQKLNKKPPQEFIDEVNKNGWIGFISHPDRGPVKQFGILPCWWIDWNVKNFTGMCLWDFMTDWLEKVDRPNVTIELHKNFVNYLTGPKQETLKKWDELCCIQKTVGICECDNHRYPIKFMGKDIIVFPHEDVISVLTNHILLQEPLSNDPVSAQKQILDAIKEARLYFSFDKIVDPTGFSFTIKHTQDIAQMGSQFSLEKHAEISVSVPLDAEVLIICNGKTIFQKHSRNLSYKIEQKGVYRIEVRLNQRPWIFSNPIYVV
jgi:hypothetical protein